MPGSCSYHYHHPGDQTEGRPGLGACWLLQRADQRFVFARMCFQSQPRWQYTRPEESTTSVRSCFPLLHKGHWVRVLAPVRMPGATYAASLPARLSIHSNVRSIWITIC